jgi:hypothetical protein
MQDMSLLNEAMAALKQSSTLMKSWVERNPAGASKFNDILTRVQQVSADAIRAGIEPPATVQTSSTASTQSNPPASSKAAEATASMLANVNAINSMASAATVVTPIPEAQQNVIDSTKRSNYVYTTSANDDKTLISLEDGLRRATDAYDAALASAKNGYCSWIPSQNGLPVYQTREQIIAGAKNNLAEAQKSFDAHKVFLADPAARSMAEVAYQIKHGSPSVGGPELNAFEQILVRERRAGNTSTDGSIALLLNKLKT